MAEMLVRTMDKINTDDPYLNVQCTKRGDVITIQDDVWHWSHLEKNSPHWTIIKVPGVDKSYLTAFLAEELGNPITNRMLQTRAFKFDLEAYAGKPAHLDMDGTLALKIRKPPIPDPNILVDIGLSTDVIG